MKKIFFFVLLLCTPILVSASSIKDLKVLNGVLSREFESDNNIYSVILNDSETILKLDYELVEEESTVKVIHNMKDEDSVTKLEVTNKDGSKEEYVFYIESEETQAVFKENNLIQTTNITKKEIPNLIWYVVTGCSCMILLLFKVIVLGFKKKKL